MAQTSTTLSGAKSHKVDITGSDISFTATSGVYTIQARDFKNVKSDSQQTTIQLSQ